MPTPTVEVQVFEERVELSNDMTWRQMIGVGVRNVVLARGRGELDKLEGPNYGLCREEGGVTQSGERCSESKADGSGVSERGRGESDESEDETAGERTRTRVRRTRGGMKVAARIGEKLRREIGSGRRPRVGDG